MRYGIPALGNRVAPRCTIADSIVLVASNGGQIIRQERLPVHGSSWAELVTLLVQHRIQTLVSGGIDRDTKQFLQSLRLSVIENVASPLDAVLAAIAKGTLESGFGFGVPEGRSEPGSSEQPGQQGTDNGGPEPAATGEPAALGSADCLACVEQVCLRGQQCPTAGVAPMLTAPAAWECMLESARDITLEEERSLCRVSELIYFCLEMDYHKVGIAYCVELEEPAQILTGLLRRFFEVYPVCCKIGGIATDRFDQGPRDGAITRQIACNPEGQAAALGRLGTDLNVVVGLCMGVDCVFASASRAPVTTLFVKDRSLANNPIGALYSDYYLKEATRTPVNERSS